MIGAFYTLGQDHWAGTEDVWEGAFALIATVIISLMGAALLRVSKLQDKWRVKLAKAMEAKHVTGGTRAIRLKRWAEKYAMFMLPFITVLREGLEAVVFVGGVSVGQPASSFPIPAICGLAAGCLVGYLIYRYVLSVQEGFSLSKFIENCTDSNTQRREKRVDSNLSNHLDLYSVPCRSRSVQQGRRVFRG